MPVNLNLERYGRFKLNGVELSKIQIGNTEVERAIPVSTAKASSINLHPTRVVKASTGPGASQQPYYPYFSPETVLPSLKAYGNHGKRPADKLWGEYIPVEYVNFANGAYINTGIVPTNATGYKVIFRTSDVTNDLVYFGCRESTATRFWVGVVATMLHVGWGDDYPSVSSRPRVTANTDITAEVNYHNSRQLKLMGNVISGTSLRTLSSVTKSIIISGYMSRDSTINVTPSTFVLVDITDGEILTNRFVPVKRKSDNVYGMLDVIEGKFCGNDGTGTITGGEVIQQVSYLQSDGNALIDTGISGYNNNLELEFDCYYDRFAPYGRFFGNYISDNANGWRMILGSTEDSSIKSYVNANTRCTSGTSPHIQKNIWNHIILNKSKIVINNVETELRYSTNGGPNNANISLFSFLSATTGLNIGLRYKNFIIRDNGVVTRNYIPVRIGTTGYMFDAVDWVLYPNAGTSVFSYGEDVNYLAPDILTCNLGDIVHDENGIHADGTHMVTITDGTTDIERDITTMLLSEISYIDIQTGQKSEAWTVIWYDGTHTIPSGYISQTGDLTPNQLVMYPLATPITSSVQTTHVSLTSKVQYTITSNAEMDCDVEAVYLGNPGYENYMDGDTLVLTGSYSAEQTNDILEVV